MDVAFEVLSRYGVWGLLVGSWIAFALLVILGKLETESQIDRDQVTLRETIERQEATIIRQDATIARKDEAFESLAEPIQKLVDQGALTVHMVDSLQQAAKGKVST